MGQERPGRRRFAIFIICFSLISDSRTKWSTHPTKPLNPSAPLWVPLTLLRNANDRGTFCLDGSLRGYYLQNGFGSGSTNWVLHIEDVRATLKRNNLLVG